MENVSCDISVEVLNYRQTKNSLYNAVLAQSVPICSNNAITKHSSIDILFMSVSFYDTAQCSQVYVQWIELIVLERYVNERSQALFQTL